MKVRPCRIRFASARKILLNVVFSRREMDSGMAVAGYDRAA